MPKVGIELVNESPQYFNSMRELLKKQSDEHAALLKKQWDEEKQYGANVGALKATSLKQISDLESKHATQRSALLTKQANEEQAHADKVSKYLENVRIKSTQIADRELTKQTTIHQRELDKQAKAEEAHALKLMKYHNMLVKNSLPQGDNQRGFREMISQGLNASGIGGRFSSSIAGIATGDLTGTAAAAAGLTASLGFLAIGTKKAYEAGIELTHQLKQEAIGYQTLGYSIEDSRKKTEANENMLASMSDKFAVTESNLREATGSFLKFGGTSEDLRGKLELMIAVQSRTGEGWDDVAKQVARLGNPEVAGRLASSLNLSTERMKLARTESERYALLLEFVRGTIKGVADESHDAEGETTRFMSSFHEGLAMLGRAGQGGVSQITGTMNSLFEAMGRTTYAIKDLASGDALGALMHMQGLEYKATEDNISAEEKEIQKRKELKDKILQEKVALQEVIDTYKKEDSQIDLAYNASKVRYAQDLADGRPIDASHEAAYGQMLEFQSKARAKAAEIYDIMTGATEPSKDTKNKKESGISNPMKVAQTEFELHGIQMKMTKEQIEIGLLQIQIKYDKLINQNAKNSYDQRVESALSSAHALERIEEIKGETEKRAEEKQLKIKEVDFQFQLATLGEFGKRRAELNKKFEAEIENAEWESLGKLGKMYSDAWEQINKDEEEKRFKPMLERQKKYRELLKKEEESAAKETEKAAKDTAKELQSVFDSVGSKALDNVFKPIEDSLTKDKSLIADIGKEFIKFGEKKLLSIVSKALFPDETEEEKKKKEQAKYTNPVTGAISGFRADAGIDKAAISITTASINAANVNIKGDSVADAGGGSSLLASLDKSEQGSALTTEDRRRMEYEKQMKKGTGSMFDSQGEKLNPQVGKLGKTLLKSAVKHGITHGVNDLPLIEPPEEDESGRLPPGSPSQASNTTKEATETGFTAAIEKMGNKKGGKPDVAGGLLSGGLAALNLAVPGLGSILGGVASIFGSHGTMIPSVQYFAGGGKARGTDTVPAMVTPGEKILSIEETRRYENMMRYGSSSNSGGGAMSQISMARMESVLDRIAQHTERSANKELINNPYDSRISQAQNVRTQLRGRY